MCEQRGENGHVEVSVEAFGDALVALSFVLVRGANRSEVQELVNKAYEEATVSESPEAHVRSLVLLAFHTRWCRGGKGEREVFYELLELLLRRCPCVVLELLALVPRYGYWKDLFALVRRTQGLGALGELVAERVWAICAKQHEEDMALLGWCDVGQGEPCKPSLYAKYFPTENSGVDNKIHAVRALSQRLYGDVPDARKRLRCELGRLREALRVTERLMSAHRFSDIDFCHVPSLCLKRNALAFLNDVKSSDGGSERGSRHALDEDRVAARRKFIRTLESGACVKGAQLFPHQLVQQELTATKRATTNAKQKLVVNKQWETLRRDVESQIAKRKAALLGEPGLDAGNLLVMADVSGSMQGTPMEVSIALGILCSELAREDCRDMVMTFDTEPKWHRLKPGATFADKVRSLSRASWGGSTDFYKALVLVGKLVEQRSLRSGEIPSLLVVSDMQFNAAANGSYARENIVDYFAQLGRRLYGEPLEPPTTIFWNVRATEVGFPAKADEEGVVLMSGFSPALFKFLFSGEMVGLGEEQHDDDGAVKIVKTKPTPRDIVRKMLQDPGLEPVRACLDAFGASQLGVAQR